MTVNVTHTSALTTAPPAVEPPPLVPLCLGCLQRPAATPAERAAIRTAQTGAGYTTPTARPAPYSGPQRAVVVRPDSDDTDRSVRQAVAYVERHGHALAAIADAVGAHRMVAAGEADIVVAARANDLALPPYVRLVSDESAGTSPSQRRPKPRRVSRLDPAVR